MKQTAVGWLEMQLGSKIADANIRISARKFFELINQAKEMEKDQIIDAYKEGMGNVDGWIVDENGLRQYYNETFKKE